MATKGGKAKPASTAVGDRKKSFRAVCGDAGVQMGLNKIFFQQVAFNRAEKARSLRLSGSCVIIQTALRGFLARKHFEAL